eukprot:TRINITY_DN38594_c0_g1_i1.p1 TRINITY_DN38594_c0_g1~~TRINITY_DN38594_c0_g1_i1.p1  ORF type:complete len:644 (+),score=81.49 TRINITY_DN38594_c0_g1_i1:112-2043(+)
MDGGSTDPSKRTPRKHHPSASTPSVTFKTSVKSEKNIPSPRFVTPEQLTPRPSPKREPRVPISTKNCIGTQDTIRAVCVDELADVVGQRVSEIINVRMAELRREVSQDLQTTLDEWKSTSVERKPAPTVADDSDFRQRMGLPDPGAFAANNRKGRRRTKCATATKIAEKLNGGNARRATFYGGNPSSRLPGTEQSTGDGGGGFLRRVEEEDSEDGFGNDAMSEGASASHALIAQDYDYSMEDKDNGSPGNDQTAAAAGERWPWPYFKATSKEAETVSSAVVMINAVAIGAQTEYQCAYPNAVLPAVFHITDIMFCVFFVAELASRFCELGLRFFSNEDSVWNVFDLVVVGVSLLDLLPISTESYDDDSFSNNILVYLRLVRFVRVFRLVRILRFVEELRTIMVCILGSMRSLAWTMLLLLMLIYIVGICLTQVVLDHRMRSQNIPTAELLYWFGSTTSTCFTLYKCITSGVSWDESVKPLIADIHPILGFLFASYIAFTVFAVLNVITGAVVEKAMEFAESDKREHVISKICELFKRTDDDGSGEITWLEFQDTLETEDMQEYFKSIDVDISEAKGLFDLLDADQSGSIDAVEFVSGCVRLTGPAKAFDIGLLLFEIRLFREDIFSDMLGLRYELEKIAARAF